MFLALPSHTQDEAHQNNQHDEIPFDFGRETFGSEKCYAPGLKTRMHREYSQRGKEKSFETQ